MSQAQNLAKLAPNVTVDGQLTSQGLLNRVPLNQGGTNASPSITPGGVFVGLGLAGLGGVGGGSSGQVLVSNGSALPTFASKPAAQVTPLSSGVFVMGMSSITISPLNLTGYKFVYIYFGNLNCMMTYSLTIGSASLSSQSNATSSTGMIMLDLVNNTCSATSMRVSGSGASYMSGTHNVTTASASITISCSPTTFNNGNYVVYGQP